MQTKHLHKLLRRLNVRALLFGAACIASAFAVGIESAGEVRPIMLIEAGSSAISGDVNEDGAADLRDVIVILEAAQGYRQPAPKELLADPNQDGRLTVDDALRILRILSAH